uniref:Cation efflux protein transmembrane domain-containing protein n=1 Tax=Fibrocapsa japonica TaxID=94617 RepID=A0A7S2UWE3_9STRA|mmetsp:Transcript_12058/g.17771  ORF Transcript_12058/g.17771 Transcript_12058/m.17771 type:complete len:272 (+) Transcript_12058:138-953(+)
MLSIVKYTKKMVHKESNSNKMGIGWLDCDHSSAKRNAIISAYLSIVAGLLEFVFSYMAGESEDSVSIMGIASMAIIEAAGSALVAWRWQFWDKQELQKTLPFKEAVCSMSIALMMIPSIVLLLYNSLDSLFNHETPDGEAQSLEVSLFSSVASLLLYGYKMHVGLILKSPVVIADAKSSLCVGLVAMVVILTDILQQLVWFADDAMGLVLSFFITYQVTTIIADGLALLRAQQHAESVCLLPHHRDGRAKVDKLDDLGVLRRYSDEDISAT